MMRCLNPFSSGEDMPYFFRDRLKIFYRDQGKGTPLLFIHGAFGSRHLWKEQTKFFATRFRVITFDVRGHGSSSKLRKGYELEKIVEDIVALLDYLKIRRSVVIGSSMGGVLALMIGFMHRSRVRALILV